MQMKAVSELVSVVLVVLISISLVGTAFMWGMPMITKRQDSSKMDRLYNYFDRENSNSIVRKIEFVAKNGGQDTFSFDVEGMWTIHEWNETGPDNNSLEFSSFTKVTNVAVSDPSSGVGWVSLTAGGECPPSKGIIGLDPSYVVCGHAAAFSGGYNVTYRIWFRELDDSSSARGYMINLTKHPNSRQSSVTKEIRIGQGDVIACPPQNCGKMTVMTTLEVLL